MKACNRKILELFYNAKHSGRIPKPDAIGRIGEDDEGIVIELTWRVIGGVIADAKFRAFGNPNAIAITSLMTDNIIGKSVDEAILIGEDVIIDNLDEFRPEYLEVYDMVRECIKEAYNNYLKRQSRKDNTESIKDISIYQYQEEVEEDDAVVARQIQLQLQGDNVVTERRGRGRPRKIVDESAIVEIGEKRGRGRPRKIVDESEVQLDVIKRGRGRPRKEIDPDAVVEIGEKRGRGRPRKIVDENAIVEIGEKRGRGRPRKIVDESEIQVETIKRGRGRPRKEVDPNEMVEVGEKRGRGRPRKIVGESEVQLDAVKKGRGRPRKEVDESLVVEVGEKRGRGRPRKEIDPDAIVEIGEKRGRGRPRKPVDENAIVEIGEKRGRGRPRKIVDESETQVDVVKRGRGRPRKEVDPNEMVEVGEKRGRGRPKKEFKYNLPSDLDDVEQDEEFEQLINGNSTQQSDINQYTAEKLIDSDDDTFDADYDLFKSNIRNIFSGKEVSSKQYGSANGGGVGNLRTAYSAESVAEKTPELNSTSETLNKISTTSEKYEENASQNLDEDSEQKHRGRPKKIVIEEVEDEKRDFARPTINSLTRSLTPSAMSAHNTQDIVFASKNVTTTNININVTKTTTSIDDNKATSSDYSHNTSISSTQQKVEVSLPNEVVNKDEEIDVEPVKEKVKTQTFADIDDYDDFEDDYDEEIDDSHIKDEAPTGGIEDLLKALLDD